MSEVLMLVINPMTADSRVEKQAASLAAAGHSVTVIATKTDELPREEMRDGYRILRLPYTRPLKTAIIAPVHRASQRRQSVRRAETVIREHQLRIKSWRPRAGALVGSVIARLWMLLGGSYLKLIRSRVLPREYWLGIGRRLPQLVPRPDLITAHDLGPLSTACRLAEGWGEGGKRPRIVYDSHELYVEQQTSWSRREKWGWRLHERRFIRQADLVTTVSAGIASELQRRYQLNARPVVILNSPRDPTRGDAATESDVRSDIGGSQDVLAVYVGAVKPGRGVHHLVPALAVRPGWQLAIVGGGDSPYFDELLRAASQLGVRERIHVLPSQPARDLPYYLRTANVGVHPMEPTCLNHALALPNKLFDYLFAGLPVAVSDLPEMAQFVREHGVGETFVPADAEQTAHAVLEAASYGPPHGLRDLIGETSWDEQERTLIAAYDSLLAASFET